MTPLVREDTMVAMKTLDSLLEKDFEEAVSSLYPELTSPTIEVTPSTQTKFGHYQFNSAMRLAKPLQKNPKEIAEGIVKAIDKEYIEKLEVAGPGFINITLSADFLSKRLNAISKDSNLGVEKTASPKRIIVDFSSPNIAKEMHVGHLRSTIIGDSIARLYEFLGHDVLRINHVGDWGTQFGMLITYLKEEAPEVLTGEQTTDLSHLVLWYKESKKKFDEDEAFKKKSQKQVVALQSGEKDALKAWEIICEISRKAYNKIYKILDIKIEERGESFYNPHLPQVIEDLQKKKLIKVENGTKCVFMEGFQNRDGDPLPLIVQKSDGGYNYATTDLAALKHRVEDEKADELIYVTDMGQAQHFAMVFKAAELAGYFDPEKVKVKHVPFGLVLDDKGKKFKTRSGDTVPLTELIETAIDKAGKILSDRKTDMAPDEIDKLAESIGISSIKYADLSSNRTGDYSLSYAFLLYAYVRVAGLKRKIDTEIPKETTITLQHPSEIELGLHLARFPNAIEEALQAALPNRLAEYLFRLAEHFNAFYRDCPVEGAKEQNSRLLLAETVASTLKTGLHLLGLHTVERM